MQANKEWLFSGAGVVLVVAAIGILTRLIRNRSSIVPRHPVSISLQQDEPTIEGFFPFGPETSLRVRLRIDLSNRSPAPLWVTVIPVALEIDGLRPIELSLENAHFDISREGWSDFGLRSAMKLEPHEHHENVRLSAKLPVGHLDEFALFAAIGSSKAAVASIRLNEGTRTRSLQASAPTQALKHIVEDRLKTAIRHSQVNAEHLFKTLRAFWNVDFPE